MSRLGDAGLTARMTNATNPTLVLGATGTTGCRVVDRLTARGVVRRGSRSGRPPFDWTDDTTWPPELRDEIRAAPTVMKTSGVVAFRIRERGI